MPDRIDQQPPEVLTFLLAEVVHRDPDTSKFSILGIHSIIGAYSFPVVHPNMVVFVEVTDGRGDTLLELRLIDVDDSVEPVFTLDTRVNFADNPNQVLEAVFHESEVTFNQAGEYRLQLYGAGQLLQERRVFVLPFGLSTDEGEQL